MARVLFELEVLRIEELGVGPFTFTVWVDDVLIEPTQDDSVSLPNEGYFAMQVCSSDGNSGEVTFELNIVKDSGCKWLPLRGTEPLTYLSEKVEGPRVLVAFTKMSLLSPVMEHGSSSERSSQLSELESPKSFRICEAIQDYPILRKAIEDLSGSVHAAAVAHADEEAQLKRKIVDLELKLDQMRREAALVTSDREALLNRRISDQNLQIEKYRLTLKAQNAALEDVKSQLQGSLQKAKGGDDNTYRRHAETYRVKEDTLQRRVRELEGEVIEWQGQLQHALQRETSLRQQCLKQQEVIDAFKADARNTDDITQLQFQLDESEARRFTLQAELADLSKNWDETWLKAQKAEALDYQKANAALLKEVESVSEQLRQSKSAMIALQHQETLWKSQFALGESAKVLQLCSNSELMTARESAVEVEQLNKDLKEQIDSLVKELKEAKDSAVKAEAELRVLKSTQLQNREEAPSPDEEIDQHLKEFLRSNSTIQLAKQADGQYTWGAKRLVLQMKRGQLLVKTGGGFILLEDYFKPTEPDPKDSSEGSTTECSDLAEDIENSRSKRHSLDYKERSVSPLLDYSKPTLSSMGKRVGRTPVKEPRSRTPRKGLHTKRLSAKM